MIFTYSIELSYFACGRVLFISLPQCQTSLEESKSIIRFFCKTCAFWCREGKFLMMHITSKNCLCWCVFSVLYFFVFLVYAVVVMSFLGAEFIRLFTIRANRPCVMFEEKCSRNQRLYIDMTSPMQFPFYCDTYEKFKIFYLLALFSAELSSHVSYKESEEKQYPKDCYTYILEKTLINWVCVEHM